MGRIVLHEYVACGISHPVHLIHIALPARNCFSKRSCRMSKMGHGASQDNEQKFHSHTFLWMATSFFESQACLVESGEYHSSSVYWGSLFCSNGITWIDNNCDAYATNQKHVLHLCLGGSKHTHALCVWCAAAGTIPGSKINMQLSLLKLFKVHTNIQWEPPCVVLMNQQSLVY